MELVLWNSEPGIGFDGDGRRKLYDHEGNVYYLSESGKVYDTENNVTSYTVDENGYVFNDGQAKRKYLF